MTDEIGAWAAAEVLWRFGCDANTIAAGLQRKGFPVTAEEVEARAWDENWRRSIWPKSIPVRCPNCGEQVVQP